VAKQSIAGLFDLTGKVAIVTGGAMGIGQAIALRLAEAGASVMITDINQDAAKETVEQIGSTGGKAGWIYADTSNVAGVSKVIQTTVEALGGLDILINNAGIYPFSSALQITEALWDKVMNINLKSTFFCAQAAARQMIEAGHGGKIVNLASIDALHPTGNLVHYDASKGGVVMLTKALALELGPHNINVNAIAPGSIRTPGSQNVQVPPEVQDHFATVPSEKSFLARIPLRRAGEPDDIAKVALFLSSGAADYMTGSLVVVDGGYLLS